MISMTDNSVPANADGVKEILALIADPKASAQRLAALQQILDQINTTADETRIAGAALDSDRAQHAADAKTLQQRIDSFDMHEKVRTKQLSDHEDVLTVRQKQLDEFETRSSSALTERETAISRREADLMARETAAASTLATANALKSTYEQKVAALEQLGLKLAAPVQHIMTADTGTLGATMGGAQ